MSRALAVAFVLVVAVAAQAEETQPVFVFGSGLDVVNVTLTVRDAEGKLVTNLGMDDFAVFEDGRAQAPVVFGNALSNEEREGTDPFAVNLGLLLDTSESMLKELRLSQQAATRFLENIPRAKDLITIFFDQDIRISRYNSENQQGLYQRIVEAKGSGNTALFDAIAVYLDRVSDTQGRKILVLLSDGEDTTSATSLGEVLQLVKASPVTIYSVAFTGGFTVGSKRALSARSVLSQLSEISGGTTFTPNASRDLTSAYQSILDELKSQYVLGYVSDNLKVDGKFRRLKVQLKRTGFRVRHRQGYVADKR